MRVSVSACAKNINELKKKVISVTNAENNVKILKSISITCIKV